MTVKRIHWRQRPPPRWEWRAGVPLAAALAWTAGSGPGWWLAAALPAALQLTAGIALLARIHDLRVHQLHAAGAALGVVLALMAGLAGKGEAAVLVGLLSAASFIMAGRLALRYEPSIDGAELPEERIAVEVKAAVDETLLAYFVGTAGMPAGPQAEAVCIEAQRLKTCLQEQGWQTDPTRFDSAPPVPVAAASDSHRYRGIAYERVRMASGFQPHPELPGASSWSARTANCTGVLRVFRHPGPDRPWLLCVHGYRMGLDWMDFGLFSPKWLHQQLGFNLLMPTLPLHGPRRSGRRSGDGYLDGDPLPLLHAQTQALWDLRQALAWLRDREAAPRVGVYGVSLGGYNAALLATVEPELDFVVAAIPLTDVAAVLWRHLPVVHGRFYEQHGLTQARYRELLKVVSPLARPSVVPAERLHVLAAAADRIVPPEQPMLLSRHWGVPVHWYQGAHLSIRHEPLTRQVVEQAMHRAGWR